MTLKETLIEQLMESIRKQDDLVHKWITTLITSEAGIAIALGFLWKTHIPPINNNEKVYISVGFALIAIIICIACISAAINDLRWQGKYGRSASLIDNSLSVFNYEKKNKYDLGLQSIILLMSGVLIFVFWAGAILIVWSKMNETRAPITQDAFHTIKQSTISTDTAAALSQTVEAVSPSTWSLVVDGAQVLYAFAAIVALFLSLWAIRVANKTLVSQQKLRANDVLLQILDYFDKNTFFIRIWQLEQLTRDGKDAWSIHGIKWRNLRDSTSEVGKKFINEALASKVGLERADMCAVYFFALRVHAWLVSSEGNSIESRTRLLNDTFGYQLLSTLLDHQIIACRLRDDGRSVNYYPTHYGLFDPKYTDITTRLADDILRDDYLQQEVRDRLKLKYDTLREYLKELKPLTSDEDSAVNLTT